MKMLTIFHCCVLKCVKSHFIQPTVEIPLSQQMVQLLGHIKMQLRELRLCLDVTQAFTQLRI